MSLLTNAWKILRQIWHTCLARYTKLAMPNFEVYILKLHMFVMWCYIHTIIAKFTEKLEAELCRIDT